ncbi:MAG: CrcB family protein, partial [Chthonomonadales bacterium]
MTDLCQRMMVVGAGGFFGANARYLLGLWSKKQWGPDFPYGTFIINVTGSFILGLFAALALKWNWNPR